MVVELQCDFDWKPELNATDDTGDAAAGAVIEVEQVTRLGRL